MKLLSKADILGADDRKFEIVAVPEWGGDVRVATFSGAQRDSFEMAAFIGNEKGKHFLDNYRARLAASTIVDENGDRMFTIEDVEALANKSGAALDRVYAVAAKLNGLTAKDVEEIAGN